MHQVLLVIHIICGSVALLSGPVAMFNQNGNVVHRMSGKIFFWAMTVVFVTAVYLSIVDELPFLLMIAFFSYYSIVTGYRALYLKKLGKGQRAKPLDWMVSIVTAVFNTALLCWGMKRILVEHQSFGIVAIVFATFGLITNIKHIKTYRKGYATKSDWLYIHIGGMIGGYIAAFTAFLVNTVHFEPSFVLWLAPSVVFVPVIIYTIRKFRKKIGGGKSIRELATIRIDSES